MMAFALGHFEIIPKNLRENIMKIFETRGLQKQPDLIKSLKEMYEKYKIEDVSASRSRSLDVPDGPFLN